MVTILRTSLYKILAERIGRVPSRHIQRGGQSNQSRIQAAQRKQCKMHLLVIINSVNFKRCCVKSIRYVESKTSINKDTKFI
jgi:hypothetical protein